MTNAPALSFSGSARFGDVPVFGPLRLEIGTGQWTCLLGPSGAGKTTLLRLIAGVDDVTDFDGQITASDGQAIAGRVAYMAQTDLLMPWLNVQGNVLLGARLRNEAPDRERAMNVLERVGLGGHSHKKPGALSGGQRQRVALARTLMEDRAIVLLDEPFSALDARTRARMQELAVELLAGCTVLLVTHDPGEAARLGHVIQIMDERGLTPFDPPTGQPPRGPDAPETLAAQGRLLALLRQPELSFGAGGS